jgi:hypothetical protein
MKKFTKLHASLVLLAIGLLVAVVLSSVMLVERNGPVSLFGGLRDYIDGRLKSIAHDHGTGGLIIRTRGEISQVQNVIRRIHTFGTRGKLLTLFAGESGDLAASIYTLAYRENPSSQYPSNGRWNEAQSLVDSWKNPYIFRIDQLRDTEGRIVTRVSIRSSGPNGVDEQGAGDDIAAEPLALSIDE